MKKAISIVIPYYNDSENILRCLRSIKDASDSLSGDHPAPDIVVVDDHSPDPFDVSISPVDVTLYRLKHNKGVGAARNKGASHVKGTHILFVDSDVMLDNAHLERLYVSMETTKCKIIQGPTSERPANSNPTLFQQYLATAWNYYEHGNWRVSVFTQCFLIEKEFFMQIGGFTEKYARSGGEEFELGLRLNAMEDGLICFDEKLVHSHHFDRLTKRMKKVYLRSRHIGAIALGMPNLPFSFTAQVLLRSAFAWVLNGCALLSLASPLSGITAYVLAAILFYVTDDSLSKAMNRTDSPFLPLLSVPFRQLEFTFITLGMARGLLTTFTKVIP